MQVYPAILEWSLQNPRGASQWPHFADCKPSPRSDIFSSRLARVVGNRSGRVRWRERGPTIQKAAPSTQL